jgi:hypothetical protein
MIETQEAQSSQELIIENTFPLRILGDNKVLCCPYEAAPNDKITLSHFNPHIVYMLAESVEQQALLSSFPRHFLFSKVGEYNLITASGYNFNGVVEVYSWKSMSCPQDIGNAGKNERKEIDIVNLTRMTHIKGLDNAIEYHHKRIKHPKEISLEEAAQVFDALRNHIPRY